jgi:hypothetical protein
LSRILPTICIHMCSVAYVSAQPGVDAVNAGHSRDDKTVHEG